VDVDLRGNPTPSQSRLNALFQIEKNFSKEVSKRSREERLKVWGRGLALPFISDRVLRTRREPSTPISQFTVSAGQSR